MIDRAAAARHLHDIYDLWDDLAAAVHQPPAPVWPPRQLSTTLRLLLDEQAADEYRDRSPLALAQTPEPVNLTALSAVRTVSLALFDLAGHIADHVQTDYDPDDPGAWHGLLSWPYGVAWACHWLAGQLDDPGLPEEFADDIRRTASHCRHQVLAALGRDTRQTPIPDRPCPSCGGPLTLHTGPDQDPSVTCQTGVRCTADTPLDALGRRCWDTHRLYQLARDLEARTAVG